VSLQHAVDNSTQSLFDVVQGLLYPGSRCHGEVTAGGMVVGRDVQRSEVGHGACGWWMKHQLGRLVLWCLG